MRGQVGGWRLTRDEAARARRRREDRTSSAAEEDVPFFGSARQPQWGQVVGRPSQETLSTRR